MLSEDRAEKLRNMACNFLRIMAAGMMQVVTDTMAGFAQTLSDAFCTTMHDDEGTGGGDISAQIKEKAPAELMEMFADQPDENEEQFRMMSEALSDEDVDALIAKVEGFELRLPKFTTKLQPEAMLGYHYLGQQGDPQMGELMGGITDWMESHAPMDTDGSSAEVDHG